MCQTKNDKYINQFAQCNGEWDENANKLNVKRTFFRGEIKTQTLAFMNNGIQNIFQMNRMSSDPDFITFVWVSMMICAAVPNERMNYAACGIFCILDISNAL